jgi:multimeric flavodoxin WrbA
LKISILNGHPGYQSLGFDNIIFDLARELIISGHQTEIFVLRDMNIKYCEGCLNCWVKTPGECTFKDESQVIRSSYVNADFVLFASPIIMGFTSALLKKSIDKLIPILHPYFDFYNSEVHHVSRYKNYPVIGILIEKSNDTDEEDLEIIKGIYTRNALNLKSSIIFFKTTQNSIKEIVHEINSI